MVKIGVINLRIEDQHINFEFIIRYIRELVSDDIFALYDFAVGKDIPVAKPETTKLLYLITLIKSPGRVLEIGSGVGSSAAVISKALPENGSILTIEKDFENYYEAKKLFSANNLSEKIKIINGDGLEILEELVKKEEKFDLIFLDGAKLQYLPSYPYIKSLLSSGGVWISDNVLYKGMVASDELMEKRKRTIVKSLRQFLDKISHDKDFHTVVIPIGDGVSLAVKQNK